MCIWRRLSVFPIWKSIMCVRFCEYFKIYVVTFHSNCFFMKNQAIAWDKLLQVLKLTNDEVNFTWEHVICKSASKGIYSVAETLHFLSQKFRIIKYSKVCTISLFSPGPSIYWNQWSNGPYPVHSSKPRISIFIPLASLKKSQFR